MHGGRIQRMRVAGSAPAEARVSLPSGLLTPGLVDLQINGAYGVDLIQATPGEWRDLARALPGTGVTAFQPTYITAPLDTLAGGLDRAARARELLQHDPVARILGVHTEGPFISPAQPGVHPVGDIRDPRPELLDTLLGAARTSGALTMVTLAPERPGGLEAVRMLARQGVRVAIGHTDATAAQVRAATDAGATMVTHLFNAQRGLGHREPGVPGQALVDGRLRLGLIADLHHVAREVCILAFLAAPGRVALVTDAVSATGMAPGRYDLGGARVDVSAEGAPRSRDGTLAGSVLSLDRAVRNLVGLGLDRAAVLEAACRIPAEVIGRADLGRLTEGARADLVWWSDDLRPLRTWVGGVEAFAAEP
ncbi:MAG: N-acetylglucosamine-6-phosphate deacetylase [Streptomycetales bacterium]